MAIITDYLAPDASTIKNAYIKPVHVIVLRKNLIHVQVGVFIDNNAEDPLYLVDLQGNYDLSTTLNLWEAAYVVIKQYWTSEYTDV